MRVICCGRLGFVVFVGLTSFALGGCRSDSPVDREISETRVSAVLALPTDASGIVAELKARPASPLAAGAAISFDSVAGGLNPRFAVADVAAESKPARVTLPANAAMSAHIEDAATGVSVDVSLSGAAPVAAQQADGDLVYPKALGSNAAVVHHPVPGGTEDFVAFDVKPASTQVAYSLALGVHAAGLRLVGGTLEVLDPAGVPRLRVAPPYVVGADGITTGATLAVAGCAVDTDPAPPWGRAVTAPGAATCQVQVTWPGVGVAYPAVLDPRWTTTGSMATARHEHTALLLATGKVLVAGGRSSNSGTTGLATAELYDRTTGTWAATASMTGGRRLHSMTQLNTGSNPTTSGKVLIAGGIDGSSSLNTALLYNPSTGTWAAAANLNAPRHLQSNTLLPDGRVLVTGGMNGTTTLQTAATYNPASGSGSWAATIGPIPPPGWRFGTATLIQTTNQQLNNKVLLVGGNNGTSTLASVFLFDPAQNAFSTLASMSGPREQHSAVVLPNSNGKILVMGGKNGSAVLATAQVFDPGFSNGSWSPGGTLTSARFGHSATVLPQSIVANGTVLVAGGNNGSGTLTSAELFSGTNTWTATPSMPSPPSQGHTATLLGNSTILLAGGLNGSTVINNARLYDATFGIACTSASQCATGHCVNGVCCDTACNTGTCGACNLAGTVGTCSPFTYGVPQSDPAAPPCSDGSAPVGCRAFDCDAGSDAGRWLATPACPGSYPACTQACPSSACKLSTQSPGHSGDIVTCSCACADPAQGQPLVVSATGCVPPSGGGAACASLCGAIADPCGGAAGCSIGGCTSSTSPAAVMAAACNPSEGLIAPVTAVADWSATVNSSASQMILTVGTSHTPVPISGTIKFNASADRFELVSLDLAGGAFTFFGRNVSVPKARLLSRASGTRQVPDPDNPSGPTTVNIAGSAALFGLSGMVSGAPNATQVLNTAPITGVFNPGAGTITLAGHFVASAGVADINVSASISNRPPQARTNGDQTVVCTGGRTGSVLLNGNTSTDADGVISRYQWRATNTAILRESEAVATANTASATLRLPLGQNRVVLNVYDDKLATAQATATINVVDSTPPALTSPGNVVVYVGEASSAVVDLGFPGVTDGCDPRPAVHPIWLLDGENSVNQPIPDPKHAVFPIGSHVVRWFVTDAGGNTSTVDQFVDVNAGSGVNVPPTLQAPPTCPDPPLTSSTPVPLDVRVCVYGRMNLTTNTREGTLAWASCANDQCVMDNLNAMFADARAIWADTVAFNVVGFKVIADPCPPAYTDASCVTACGGPTTFLPNNYGDTCNFDAESSGPPGFENRQSLRWCQQAWGFQPRGAGDPTDQCERGVVAVIGNKVASGNDCAYGDNGSPLEGLPQGDNVPNFACDDPTKANNNDQGAWLTFSQTDTNCFAHTLAHELGHALGMHHGDGVDNNCDGVWDQKCDNAEFNADDCMALTSLMCGGGDSPIVTNLQKNRVRVFASRTPPNGGLTVGQNCGTPAAPPLPIDVGKPTVKTSGGCGCATAPPGSGVSLVPILLGFVVACARRSARRRQSTKK